MEITNVIEWKDSIETPITAENLNRVNTGTEAAINTLESSINDLLKEQTDRIQPIYDKNAATLETASEAEGYINKANTKNETTKSLLNGNKIKLATFLPDEIDKDTLYFLYRMSDIPDDFAEATPEQIKNAFETNNVPSNWKVGDTTSVTLTDGTTYTLRLLDTVKGRYEKANGSGYSNCVIGFDEIIQEQAQMNSSNTNVGGWVESKMYKETMPAILSKLPAEWRNVISTVKIASTVGGASTSISYSDNKVFLPARVEVFDNVTGEGYKEEGTEFEYYKNSGSRIKNYNGSALVWWLRSPVTSSSVAFTSVNTKGNYWDDIWANSNCAVSVCFAL